MDQKTQPRIFPMSWRNFDKVINGKLKQFWVQDLPENDFDLALDYLCKYFLRDEPICRSLKATEDEESIKNLRIFWRKCLEQKCSLACYTKNENGGNEMVALNCLVIKSVTDEVQEVKGKVPKKLFGNLIFLENFKNAFQELKIDSYLVGYGLVTIPEYRSYNIGLEILNCRKMLCKALGLKASLTMFTAPTSQRLAEKAGFKDFAKMSYEEIGKRDPSLKLPNVELYSKYLRHMYILYEF